MPAHSPITVALTRFEDLLAMGLHALLAGDPSVSVVAQDIAPDRISVMLRAHRPRVLILDLRALRDLAQVRELRIGHPHTHLVLLGDAMTGAECAQALAFGASACLAKTTQARDVRNAIHLASRGLQVMPLGVDVAAVRDPLLTRRQGDVLLLLRQGRSNPEIALELQIGVETVRTHARSIYRKLGVTSRRALLALTAPAPEPPAPAVARPVRRRPPSRAVTRRSRHD